VTDEVTPFFRTVGEKVNWPNGPREAGLDHAGPYECGVLDCKIGAALCGKHRAAPGV